MAIQLIHTQVCYTHKSGGTILLIEIKLKLNKMQILDEKLMLKKLEIRNVALATD